MPDEHSPQDHFPMDLMNEEGVPVGSVRLLIYMDKDGKTSYAFEVAGDIGDTAILGMLEKMKYLILSEAR